MDSLQDAVFRFVHDVGSPLTIVRTLAQLLTEEPGLSTAQRTDLGRILEASRDIHQKLITLREFASRTTPTHSDE